MNCTKTELHKKQQNDKQVIKQNGNSISKHILGCIKCHKDIFENDLGMS